MVGGACSCRLSQYFLQVVKCVNEECCAAPTSALKTVLPERFFPAALAVINSDGIRIPDDSSEGHFLGLFQRLSMKLTSVTMQGKECPYDMSCPSVKSAVEKRTCNICGL